MNNLQNPQYIGDWFSLDRENQWFVQRLAKWVVLMEVYVPVILQSVVAIAGIVLTSYLSTKWTNRESARLAGELNVRARHDRQVQILQIGCRKIEELSDAVAFLIEKTCCLLPATDAGIQDEELEKERVKEKYIATHDALVRMQRVLWGALPFVDEDVACLAEEIRSECMRQWMLYRVLKVEEEGCTAEREHELLCANEKLLSRKNEWAACVKSSWARKSLEYSKGE